MQDYITGIQQIGIGVKNLRESTLIYKDIFGLDVLIFDDTSDAHLMTQYTGGRIFNRHAVFTMNLAGGGGFEVWQYKNREPQESKYKVKYGDFGIYAAKIKSKDIDKAHFYLFNKENLIVSEVQKDPAGRQHFWVKDNAGNCFNIVQGHEWFKNMSTKTGAVTGAVIGVSNMQKAIQFYSNFLGIDVSKEYFDAVVILDSNTENPIHSQIVGSNTKHFYYIVQISFKKI